MSLKFKPKPQKAEIPLPEGAVVLMERPTRIEVQKLRQEARRCGIVDPNELGDYVVERFIVGWKDILDEKDKPLKLTDTTRAQIYEYMKKQVDALEALIVFEGGNLGNSQAGSTANTPGSGTRAPAGDASSKK